jgi:hypothetical protein
MPVDDLLQRLPAARQQEADQLALLMAEVTGEEPVVWASRIVGFGRYRYRYASGRAGDAPLAAFAPTPRQHTIYLGGDFQERYPRLLTDLGPATCGKGCLYVKRLADIDLAVLRTLVTRTVRVHRGQDVGAG